ncbi:MAG: Asp23/Gls24 family envelope stress response protein [Firmicutes bacterium]|nr:Asp23/Gls24 family envelope stress response protein [Bacillota bacterium]
MAENKSPEYSLNDISLAAMHAALGTDGVAEMTDVPITNMLENLIQGTMEAKGIRVWLEKDVLNMMVFLNVEYGCKIPTTAWNVQANIKNTISGMTTHSIGRIDINIQGVHCPDTDTDS